MVKYHFITYATDDHMSYAKENLKTAMEIGHFDIGKIYTPNDIEDFYKNKNSNLFKYKRLGGYSVWRAYIIMKHLSTMEPDDILCYNDSKYLWLKDIREFQIHNFQVGVYLNKPNSGEHLEKTWTKYDAYVLMNVPNIKKITDTPQVWSGFVLLKKCMYTLVFISEWMTYNQDPRICTDSPSVLGKNDDSFIENRHDQTILSLLCKKWNIPFHFMDKSYMVDIRNP